MVLDDGQHDLPGPSVWGDWSRLRLLACDLLLLHQKRSLAAPGRHDPTLELPTLTHELPRMFNLQRFFAGTLSAPSPPNVSQPVETTPPPPERPKQRVYLEGPAPPTQDRPILADGRLKVPPPRIPVSAGPFLVCFDCKK